MYFVSEQVASQVVTMAQAISCIEKVFYDYGQNRAQVFPVALGRGPQANSFFSMKAGLLEDQGAVGLKVGSYWPDNRNQDLPAHSSSTLLLDPHTGYAQALVGASHLTCLRTAAADAVAVAKLSRQDSSTLAIVGAGHQAWFELLAVREVRPITKVLIVNRSHQGAQAMAQRITQELSLKAQAATAQEALPQADIIVTITAARATLVAQDLVRPGTHISAMGADAPGKQELDPKLVASASLFADVLQQSISVGEYEQAFNSGLISKEQITSLGAVLAGSPGRQTDEEITIFDSSGMALQDIAICSLALEKALDLGLAKTLD